MKFVFKVLVLVCLIVLSKLAKDEEQTLVAVKTPQSVEQKQVSDYQNVVENKDQFLPQASEAKVEKASLQFN